MSSNTLRITRRNRAEVPTLFLWTFFSRLGAGLAKHQQFLGQSQHRLRFGTDRSSEQIHPGSLRSQKPRVKLPPSLVLPPSTDSKFEDPPTQKPLETPTPHEKQEEDISVEPIAEGPPPVDKEMKQHGGQGGAVRGSINRSSLTDA